MSKDSGVTQGFEAVESLVPNPWNTNRMSPDAESKLEASIRRFGMFKPIVVRELADGTLQILGGQHRWEAAMRMGHERVPVINLGKIPDKRAKEIGLVDNGRYGADDPLELTALIKELGEAAELAEFLPFENLDIGSMFSGAGAPGVDITIPDTDAEQPPIELPSGPPAHQIMRFKVPVEDVAWIQSMIETTMRDQRFTGDDSQTNAGNAFVFLLNKVRSA